MKTKTIIIILVILVILAAGTWIYLGTKPAAAADNTEPGTGTPEAAKAQAAADTVKMPLTQGSKGQLIADIQTALNSKYKAGLMVDGDWGPKTQAALKANNLPTIIYWKQYSEITGYTLLVAGKKVQAEIDNTAAWWSTLPVFNSIPFINQVASSPNYFNGKY